ncbi:MAG: helix-turn-helix domain-containing protein [Oscillospiraceae bacterium]|nr:helix-turn-helix domain-containing protein [Oscillospiraceae bacterium]
MSLEELRERNKSLVTEKALEAFIKNGIDNTKIKDIAKSAGLTERSAYRYFETKTDIVQAAAYLFWNNTLEKIRERVESSRICELNGIKQIRALLYQYSNLYFENRQGVLFTLDAEMYLYSAGRSKTLNRPPEKFDTSTSPLVLAIRKGIEDGSVNPEVNVKELYYNAYDSILGVMQKLALEASGFTELDNKQRMKDLCDLFVRAFKGD